MASNFRTFARQFRQGLYIPIKQMGMKQLRLSFEADFRNSKII